MLMIHAAQDDTNFFGPCNGTLFEYEVLAEVIYNTTSIHHTSLIDRKPSVLGTQFI
jgi:hypothetical protein